MQSSTVEKIRGIDDVIAFIDSRPGITGRAGLIWWLALGGLFLDAFANSALSAGLGPMTRDLGLKAGQVALMTSFAAWVAIAFNPIGGWMADRWGRIRPLIIAKFLAVIGALLVMFAPSFEVILVGRFFVGAAYGIDFAIAMAVLAEFTPLKFKSRLNTWQGMWYTAVCTNLLLALLFFSWDVGDSIWRYSVAATAIFAVVILVLQLRYMVESPIWLARKERIEQAAIAMTRIYGRPFAAAPLHERVPVVNQAKRGMANVLLIFRGVYLPRTILADHGPDRPVDPVLRRGLVLASDQRRPVRQGLRLCHHRRAGVQRVRHIRRFSVALHRPQAGLAARVGIRLCRGIPDAAHPGHVPRQDAVVAGRRGAFAFHPVPLGRAGR
ncbi:transporter, major facilitator family protein [Achromobacter piechaudii ATCC 43553]|uniref:Transporter, major facilitator family protein n=1 Tax=Achromobacter piechaudii ATCC 43553 TaxID=742159 RepID=D4XF67_9BURK|nr:transporter, major facilitator family protein [Achromobacter piechaudii ATCC 43553]